MILSCTDGTSSATIPNKSAITVLWPRSFFAAFGNDGIGAIGTPTTINSGDMAGVLVIAVQALEKRTTELREKKARIEALESRLEALERRIGSYAVTAKAK